MKPWITLGKLFSEKSDPLAPVEINADKASLSDVDEAKAPIGKGRDLDFIGAWLRMGFADNAPCEVGTPTWP